MCTRGLTRGEELLPEESQGVEQRQQRLVGWFQNLLRPNLKNSVILGKESSN